MKKKDCFLHFYCRNLGIFCQIFTLSRIAEFVCRKTLPVMLEKKTPVEYCNKKALFRRSGKTVAKGEKGNEYSQFKQH